MASFDSDVATCDFSALRSDADVIGTADAIKPAIPKREMKLRRVERPNSEEPSASGLSSLWAPVDINCSLARQRIQASKKKWDAVEHEQTERTEEA